MTINLVKQSDAHISFLTDFLEARDCFVYIIPPPFPTPIDVVDIGRPFTAMPAARLPGSVGIFVTAFAVLLSPAFPRVSALF